MKILIALDESPISERAARVAADLFSSVPDTEFLVIDVARIPAPWVGSAGFGVVAPLDPPSVAGRAQAGTGEEEGKLAARARSSGVEHADPLVRTGDPATEICRAADEHDVDLIVVGSHDKSALERLVDPSVAAGVIRDTYRPVLVVSGTPPTVAT